MTLLKVKQLKGPTAGSIGEVISFDGTVPRWSSDLSSGIAIPNGTTVQRPLSTINGYLRYNSETNSLESSSNGNWRSIATLDSPIFTGIPTAPIPTDNTNPARIATTGFVINSLTSVTSGVSSVLGFDGNISLSQLVSAGVSPLNSNVRIITSGSSYSCSSGDQYIVIKKTTASITSIILPSLPVTGQIVNVKDGTGNSQSFNVTVSPISGFIDGRPNFVIDQPYQSTAFLYNGAEWNVV